MRRIYTPNGEVSQQEIHFAVNSPSGYKVVKSARMNSSEIDLQNLRRKRLREEINGPRFNGNQAAFCKEVGRSATQINDMLSEPPRKSFGDRVARSFAEQLGYPPWYFDTELEKISAHREINHENQPALLPKSNTQTSQSGRESMLSVREPAAKVIRLVSAMDAAGKFTEELADAIERVIQLQAPTPTPATASLDTAGAALALAQIADRFAGREMLSAEKLQHMFLTLINAQRAELAIEAKQQKTETVNHEEK